MSINYDRRDLIRTAIVAAGVLPASVRLATSRPVASQPIGTRAATRRVDLSRVRLEDEFWRPKQLIVATVTVQVCIVQTEQKSGRIRNFEKASRCQGETHEGEFYDDSDIYKAVEAMAYTLVVLPDPALEAKADSWIEKNCSRAVARRLSEHLFRLDGT
jgi:hypothetical protein